MMEMEIKYYHKVKHQVQHHRVINYTFIIIFLFCLLSCTKQQESKDDYIILNKKLVNYKEITKDSLFLIENGSNSQILFMFKKHLEIDFLNKEEYSRQLMLKRILKDTLSEIKQDSVINNFFNIENYEFIKQNISDNYVWNFNLINKNVYKEVIGNKPLLMSKSNIWRHSRKKLQVSKPLYSKDGKYALLYFNYRRSSGYEIYVKKKNDWVFYKMVNLLIE